MVLEANGWFKDCYKDIIDTLLNLEDPFFDINSRLIDLCTDSIDTDV